MNLSEHFKEKIEALNYTNPMSFIHGAEYVLDSITPDVCVKFLQWTVKEQSKDRLAIYKEHCFIGDMGDRSNSPKSHEELFSYWITNIFKP